jgi:hypothetical protein
MAGEYLVSTKHPETPLACALSARGKQIDIEKKIAAWYLCGKLGQEFESCRARHKFQIVS